MSYFEKYLINKKLLLVMEIYCCCKRYRKTALYYK